MYVNNFSAGDALSALKWRSGETALNLRVFCEQLMREVVAAKLTAHERVGDG